MTIDRARDRFSGMTKSIYDFSVETITGQKKTLAEYKGKPLLIVNVASACGLTPQYAGLEALNEAYASKGLAILGFPANEFGAQEPGSNAEINAFCTTKFGVNFDMFSKVVVKGEGLILCSLSLLRKRRTPSLPARSNGTSTSS